jgi:hypothetical protein
MIINYRVEHWLLIFDHFHKKWRWDALPTTPTKPCDAHYPKKGKKNTDKPSRSYTEYSFRALLCLLEVLDMRKAMVDFLDDFRLTGSLSSTISEKYETSNLVSTDGSKSADGTGFGVYVLVCDRSGIACKNLQVYLRQKSAHRANISSCLTVWARLRSYSPKKYRRGGILFYSRQFKVCL